MTSSPERRAWMILMAAFAIFIVLAVTVPLSIRWLWVNSTTLPFSALRPIEASVLIRSSGETDFRAVTEDRDDIVEGSVIATDEYSRAFIRLFENSTLTLYNDTSVDLDRVRTPRFASSSRDNQIVIHITCGRVVIGVAPPHERPLQMTIKTPHAEVTLEEGGYSVLVSEQETQVTARLGKATIIAGDEIRTCRNGRCHIVAGQPIKGPLPPEQNLIVNGTFDTVLGSGWSQPDMIRQDTTDPEGEAEIVAADGRTVLSFTRSGARTHGELSTTQHIDKDVRDFTLLRFSCEVQVSRQSLAGGGFESSEFPIMIELTYKDVFGDTRSRYWGFYYLDPGSGPEWRTLINGVKVVQDEWYLFESANLMVSMGEYAPVYIESVRIYASGWDFDSAITNVSLRITE